MNDRNLARGLLLIAVSLAFGLPSLRYPLGDFSSAGPGLFPLMMSGVLLFIGLAIVVRSHFIERAPILFNLKNIALILGSLIGFAVLSQYVNMIAGIVFMVFCAALAGTSFSVVRNLRVAAALVVIAFGFQKLLGLNLPLY